MAASTAVTSAGTLGSPSCPSSPIAARASHQFHRPSSYGCSTQEALRLRVGRGFVDSRRRLKGHRMLRAVAVAEAGEEVLSAREKYLQSIYGPSQQPPQSEDDVFGGLKDVFKTFGNSKSDTGSGGKERVVELFESGGGENRGNTGVSGLEGLKDIQDNATKSAESLFKRVKDSIGDAIPSSSSVNEVKTGAINRAKETLNSFSDGVTDAMDSFKGLVKGGGLESASDSASTSNTAESSAESSIPDTFKTSTDSAESIGTIVEKNPPESSLESGLAGESFANQNSGEGIVNSLTKYDEAGGGSVTNNIVEPKVNLPGEAVTGGNDPLSFSDVQAALNSPGTSLTDSLVDTEAPGATKESLTDVLKGAIEPSSGDNSSVDSVLNPPNPESVLSAQEKYLQSIKGGFQQSESSDVFDGLRGGDVDVMSGLKDAQEALSNSVNSVVDSITGAFDTAGTTIRNQYDNVNESISGFFKSLTGSLSKSEIGLPSNLDTFKPKAPEGIDFSAPFRSGTPINDAVKEIVVVVKGAAGQTVVTAGELITKAYSSGKNLLPEGVVVVLKDIENKVSQASEPFGQALHQVQTMVTEAEKAVGIDPENVFIPVVVVLGGTLFISIKWFESKYGGYAGDLQPSEALELLKNEGNVLLVDIRPQEVREDDGIPDLRRSTRFKSAALEVLKADKTIRGQLKNSNEIDSLLTAAVIRNLKGVDGGTKIIVLDEDGSKSKHIARGLKKSGTKRAYRIEGGFKAWTAEGLRSKSETLQSPLTFLKEETEAIVEEYNPTVGGVAGVFVGLIAATYALLEWEKTLQVIGLIGLATTLYLRIQSYESVEDAKKDLQVLQKPLKALIQGLLVLTGQARADQLQLATSPASSAVQGRILQAAAKHGAAAEREQGDEGSSNITEASDEEIASAVDNSEEVVEERHSTSITEQEVAN